MTTLKLNDLRLLLEERFLREEIYRKGDATTDNYYFVRDMLLGKNATYDTEVSIILNSLSNLTDK